MSVLAAPVALAIPAWAGPPSHALELSAEGAAIFVDLPRVRLLRFQRGELAVLSRLEGVPPGPHLQNLVSTPSGELFLGDKKSVWRILEDGTAETMTPPVELKALFLRRPADLAPDGSIYVARDFRSLERTLPGGDAHPVPVQGNIGKIHSLTVTPYGRVFFSSAAEIVRVAPGKRVEVLLDNGGDAVLGMAADSESSVLVLRLDKHDALSLVRVDLSGRLDVVLTPARIAGATQAVAAIEPTTKQ